MLSPTNPFVHVEIPVTHMDRALRFYSGVLGLDFERRKVDGYD
ncbi:MAG: VOC family protein, partial [Alphaproteobacteria bacterium]